MKKYRVKNTTKCGLFDLISPCKCRVCGEVGNELCECCKNYISGTENRCPKCYKVIRERCEECNLPFFFTFTLGMREGVLGSMVEDLKYKGERGLARVLAEMVDEKMPEIRNNEGEVWVVPLPTIARHIRERGLDHTKLVAKKLAKKRGYKVFLGLARKNNTVQVGADAATRRKQAKEAYGAARGAVASARDVYLLYDDVWTTGASMMAAREVLVKMGADPEKIGAVVLVKGGK